MCGLSHKQRWRRQSLGLTVPKLQTESRDDSDGNTDCGEDSSSEASGETKKCPDLEEQTVVCVNANTKRNLVVVKQKRVSFYSAVSVILIPSINEYRQALLFDKLWYGPKDYKSFQESMVVAVKRCMNLNSFSDPKQAIKLVLEEPCDENDSSMLVV